MRPRCRFIIALLAALLLLGFCASHTQAQDRAHRRDGGQSTGARRDTPPPPAGHPGRPAHVQQPPARQPESRSDAQRRHPQPRAVPREDGRRRQEGDRDRGYRPQPGYRPYGDARGRHPRPDGYYRGDRDRYHWRYWSHRERWDHDRFPRWYFGLRLFDGYWYRGHPFGPHYRLWFYSGGWRACYWPFAFPPDYGCGWYWVPTHRWLRYDPETDEEYWDYTDYEYVYLCFD